MTRFLLGLTAMLVLSSFTSFMLGIWLSSEKWGLRGLVLAVTTILALTLAAATDDLKGE